MSDPPSGGADLECKSRVSFGYPAFDQKQTDTASAIGDDPFANLTAMVSAMFVCRPGPFLLTVELVALR